MRIVAKLTLLLALLAGNVWADCTSPTLVGIGNFGVEYIVPAGCDHMKVKCQGGGGNGHPHDGIFYTAGGAGGNGGFIAAIFTVTPGKKFYWTAGNSSDSGGFSGGLCRINWSAPFIPPGIGVLAAGSGGGGGGKLGQGTPGNGGHGGGVFGSTGTSGMWFGTAVPGGTGGTSISPGSGGAAPTGNCIAGPGGGPAEWTCAASAPGPYGGRGGTGYKCGGSGASCYLETGPPLGGIGDGGGGGGGSSYANDTFQLDEISMRQIPGTDAGPGGAGDPDYVGPYGQGGAGGRVSAPAHKGAGARVQIFWDEDLQFDESNAPEDGDLNEICEFDYENGGPSFEWPGAPEACENDGIECRKTFEDGSEDAICRYSCPTAQTTHVFRVNCS